MTGRDFSTISPSAKSLLLVKAETSLPFARHAAELLFGPDAVARARAASDAQPGAQARRRHFELRAQSIDDALADTRLVNILELAAGLSFRGLAMAAARDDVDYLDTDLPGLIEIKRELLAKLAVPCKGTLRCFALDALDAAAFRAAVGQLQAGPIAIVHEGLMMYLDDAGKAELAANVRDALRERGGAWITADIYVRTEMPIFRDARTEKFLADHRVDENKFASFAAAEAFFTAQRLAIVRRAAATNDPQHIRETWTLRLA